MFDDDAKDKSEQIDREIALLRKKQEELSAENERINMETAKLSRQLDPIELDQIKEDKISKEMEMEYNVVRTKRTINDHMLLSIRTEVERATKLKEETDNLTNELGEIKKEKEQKAKIYADISVRKTFYDKLKSIFSRLSGLFKRLKSFLFGNKSLPTAPKMVLPVPATKSFHMEKYEKRKEQEQSRGYRIE
ncbi:hypothetical protein FACS1894152_6050 [Bacilli bacterium]|nr:hypothetical protein FACS1894152_6050 [Bacilli bacterium]